MKFAQFAREVLLPLEDTSKKLVQTQALAQLLHTLPADDVAPAVYILLGQMGPLFHNPDFGFGIEMMLYALAQLEGEEREQAILFGSDQALASATHKDDVKRRYKQLGDVGNLAEKICHQQGQDHSALTLREVWERLQQLTAMSGEGSQEEKIRFVAKLLSQLDPLGARYVARFIVGRLRLGFSDRTMLDALSWFVQGDKSMRPRLDEVYQRHPDVGAMAAAVVRGGMAQVEKLSVALGVPVLPALCDRLRSTEEMVQKMGEVYVEPKYDGTRLQIHYDARKKTVQTFTRNLEENTWMFPELPELLAQLPVQSVVLDCEAVGYSPTTGELRPFQETIKRKRKHEVAATAAAIPLKFFVFDILLLDGVSLLRMPLMERRARLEKLFARGAGDIVPSPSIRTDDPVKIRTYHKQQLHAGLEGIVVKQVQGAYEPGRKAFNWVKLKEAEGEKAKLADTLDVVVLGYYFGRGKRTQFGVGAFLVGVLDEERGTLATIAKIGTGLSDEQWRELKERADAVRRQGGAEVRVDVPEALQPDVIVPPHIVCEVAADEITISPVHSAGLALRFPRLVRFRDDKSVAQCTTLAEVRQLRAL